MEFGPKLRELREQAGMTQYELAEGIAASSYISLLEAGKRKPKPELILKLSGRLGIPVEQLLVNQSAQERELNLNTAKVALSSGDLELAEDFAKQVMEFAPPSVFDSASLAASVVLLQVKARRGLFDGVVDELEQLYKSHPKASPDVRARIGNEIEIQKHVIDTETKNSTPETMHLVSVHVTELQKEQQMLKDTLAQIASTNVPQEF